MYQITLDDKTLYYPGDREAAVINPQLNLQTGYAGELKLQVPKSNPLYGEMKNRKSMLSVFRDEKEIFYGELRTGDKDRNGNKTILATGALSFLADSIMPQQEWNLGEREMLEAWLQCHNSQVEDRKKIYIGIVTIHSTEGKLYRITDGEKTLSAIREQLVGKLGGYLRLRHENQKLYLDWITLEEYGKYCEQTIQFGENLLDYAESTTSDNIITALVPLGAAIEQEYGENATEFERLEKNVDITSVNDGKNYIYIQNAVDNFGWVWGRIKWDDISSPAELLKKANEYLATSQYETLTISLTAVDLSIFGMDYDAFEIGDRVLCVAPPYGMEKVFPIMEMQIPLQRPDQAQLTLGETKQKSFTQNTSGSFVEMKQETTDSTRVQTNWMKAAIDNLTNQMTGAKGGYKLSEYDENGLWIRDLYMDAPDKNLATKILQINSEGIGGSHNGYNGPYTTGMTLDGTIIGERILAGSVKTEALSVECKNYIESKIAEGDAATQGEILKEVTTSINAMDGKIDLSVSTLEQQLERKSGNWYGNYVPTSQNNPASGWITDEQREEHERDLFFDTSTGYAYQYIKNNNEYGWTRIKDKDIEAAQSTAESALSKIEVAEGKIIAEVERAQGAEENLRSSIEMTEESILSKVSQKYSTKEQLQSEVSQTAEAIKTEVSKIYATSDQVQTAINQSADSILLQVNKKVGEDEIISAINQSAEGIKIRANIIDLEGNISISALSTSALNEIKEYSNTAEENAKKYTLQQIANLPEATGNLIKGAEFSATDLSQYWECAGTITTGQSDPAGGSKAIRIYANQNDCFVSAKRSTNQVIYNAGRYTITIWLKASKSQTVYISFNRATISCSVTTSWKKFTFIRDISSVEPDYQLFTIGGFGSIATGDGYIYAYNPEVIFGYTSTEIFNMLTNNGETQGLYLAGNKIYLNGEYIKANTIGASALKADSVTADKINVADLYALGATIAGWKIGSWYIEGGTTQLRSDGSLVFTNSAGVGVTISRESHNVTIREGLTVYCRGASKFTDGTGQFNLSGISSITGGNYLVRTGNLGSVCQRSSSSKRYKNHAGDLAESEAQKILTLPVIRFIYKDGYLHPNDRNIGKEIPGFYAEDVEMVNPILCTYNENGLVEDWNERMLIPYMVKMIQIQQDQIKRCMVQLGI